MFKNREDAANQLLEVLKKHKWETTVLVITLPRGGVPVGDIIATGLQAQLELVVPRKISSPQNDELSVGALSEDGQIIWNEVEHAFLEDDWIVAEKIIQLKESKRRRKLYGCHEQMQSLNNKEVIIVDDGIASGLTMKAALHTVKQGNPCSITIAVPLAPIEIIKELRHEVDEIICLQNPRPFMLIGSHYELFPQVSDEEVIDIMKPHCLS